MPASVSVPTLGNIHSGEPRARIAALSLVGGVKQDSQEMYSSGFNPFDQESSVSPEGKEDNEAVTTASPAEDAGLSPRSMLSRARASSPRNCLILEEFLALPEFKPTPAAGTNVCAVKKTASVRGPSPLGLQGASSFAQKANVEKPKVLPPPSAIWKSQPERAWLLPSTILQNSIDLIGCKDSQVDEFDDLAIFVGLSRRCILEDAWMNVIAAVAAAAEKQDPDSKLAARAAGEDVRSVAGCGSMDDPVVEPGPRANGGMEGAYRSKLTSGGRPTEANPFNLPPYADSASPRWEALTIEPL
ncbi:hypothetical protein M407DRAFT_26660 [Tulasnella calospora MUT 4182]|uniref:Uncharacterized protein n=1 Tax=Tulasnella calospora MUT 4182 TaxID=1051891 RepID=A0A0C3LR62_9AGAM|nr:hypothetical protein M407DRAFT_26660 [Tulasnella calospora MUT 4182]